MPPVLLLMALWILVAEEPCLPEPWQPEQYWLYRDQGLTGAGAGAQLDLELPASQGGDFNLEVVMTMARDYGIVQFLIDGEKVGEPVDLFNTPEVITTGVVTLDQRPLTMGNHKLSVQIVGTNPNAVPAHMFGLDYVRLVPVSGGK